MIIVPTLLAFGFGNLAMLGWLAAAAAPLLIHLWSRRRYHEVPWAAVQFLLAAIRKNSRRIQLQQWLLLAVRTLILVLVIVAVAEPYGYMLGRGSTGVPTHRVIVIDTSFSMAYQVDDVSRLARAKRMASEIVDDSGRTDALTVIALADPPRQIVGRDLLDRTVVKSNITGIAQSHGRANLSATLDLISTAIQLTSEERQRLPRQEVIFITDLQRSTWQPPELDGADFSSRLVELSKPAALAMIDVGAPHAINTAVTDLHAAETLITVGRDATFSATLHEFSDQQHDGCVVELLLDDRPVAQQSVDIPAGGNATVQFTQRFRAPGSHTVAVRAASDRLDIDNTRWLAVPVAERINVLCVGGSREDCKYIAEALDPSHIDDSPVRPEIITEGELAETEFAPFDCVILSNIAQLTREETDRLARYVKQGGGLAVFLGDRVIVSSYNAAITTGADSANESLLPAQLGDIVAEARFGIDPLDYRHPIVAPFRGRERAGLLSTPVSRYFRLKLPDNNNQSDIAAATQNGDPLIVTRQFGRGRLVLVATAGSLASVDAATGEPWTGWPAWPSFLPVVRGILSYALGGKQDTWQSIVGQPLIVTQPLRSQGESAEITRPDGLKAPMSRSDSPEGTVWSYSSTDTSGIYSLLFTAASEPIHFAVNVDTRESDLTPADPQRLPTALRLRTTENDAKPADGSDYVAHIPWHRSLLWSAIVLVFVELCLAWLFGRGTV